MDEVVFQIQGSSDEPYSVVVSRSEKGQLTAQCSCPAGEFNRFCKHRRQILDGEAAVIISDNVNDIEVIKSWLPNTEVELVLKQLAELETEQARIKKELTKTKKALVEVLM